MLMPRWSGGRLWSKLVDVFCACGESPPRVIVSAAAINLVIAFVFFILGVNGPDGEITPTTLFTRHLAAAHAFSGAFIMAMFVTVFGKKMTRG
jgi:hypothetical protein